MGIVSAPPAGNALPSIGRPSGAPTVAPVLPSRPQGVRVPPATYQPQPAVQAGGRAGTAAVLETEPAQAYESEFHGNAAQVPAAAVTARPVSPPDPRLRQASPARSAPSRAPEVRSQSRSNGLFAEPRNEPAAAPAPRSRSLFGIVTGAIRGSAAASGPAEASARGNARPSGAQARAESPMHDGRTETTRASVRPSAEEEEMQIDIPAFLRRQSS
jgi:cell division protein FtsZ